MAKHTLGSSLSCPACIEKREGKTTKKEISQKVAYELLEALKEAQKFLNDGDSTLEYKRPHQYKAWKKCQQAISRAEGE